jgi:hypothetical protein
MGGDGLMRRLLFSFCRFTGMARFSLPSFSVVVVFGALALALPQFAAAEASPGPESEAGPSGLPDGRVYEQVSPTNKFGNQAAAPIGANNTPPYIAAGIGGDEVAFSKTGPFGEAPSGFDAFSVARRSDTGWKTHAAVARGQGVQGLNRTNPESGLLFSSEMATSVFGTPNAFVPEQDKSSPTPHIYRYDEDGTVQWIGKPTISEPVGYPIVDTNYGVISGGSPSFDTIYFGFQGALVQADEEPDPALGNLSYVDTVRAGVAASGNRDGGFYEWHDGTLEAAGVLPDGHVDPYGATPAGTGGNQRIRRPEELSNQVSEDGRAAFFVSPDPESNSGRPPELYARLTAADGTKSTKLVSRDLLLAESGGQPASAPTGLAPVSVGEGSEGGFFYASPDGSHAFFESTDQLTQDAPADTSVKEYEFDLETNSLTYLPGVADLPFSSCSNCAAPTIRMLQSSRDGSNFLFKRENQLDLWDNGVVTEVAPIEDLPEAREPKVVRSTPSGSVYVFQASAPFANFGFNNANGAYDEVYRYVTSTNTLSCVSCPPVGTAPSGNTALSHTFPDQALGKTNSVLTANHGISEDGSRVFFDTPDPLLVADTNGVRDAYEWREGIVQLISTGVSKRESFSGDTSPSGNDVFFSTAEGLAAGDTDESYDLYDARVPRPGDQPPPAAVPCEGSVCQGQPSVPQLLSQPASEAFSGAGNLEPPVSGRGTPKSLTRKQKLTQALKACKSKKSKSARKKCERKARGAYGSKAAGHSSGNRHNNGRGK